MSILNLNSSGGRSPIGKRNLKVWMGIGIVVAVLGVGSTLASTITLNGGTTTEFGQGVQRTVYCGGGQVPITVTPTSRFANTDEQSDTHTAGTFLFSGVTLSDIPDACSGVDFSISLYDTTGHATPLPMVYGTTHLNPHDNNAPDDTGADLVTATVYWAFHCPSNVSNLSDCNQAKFPGGIPRTVLSSSKDSASPVDPSVAVTSAQGGSFTLQLYSGLEKRRMLTTDQIGKIVVETQNDTFGYGSLPPL